MSRRTTNLIVASLSGLIVGLTFGGSLVWADQNEKNPVMVALLKQQSQLDQQIGKIEQRIIDVQRPFHSEAPHQLTALIIEKNDNDKEGK